MKKKIKVISLLIIGSLLFGCSHPGKPISKLTPSTPSHPINQELFTKSIELTKQIESNYYETYGLQAREIKDQLLEDFVFAYPSDYHTSVANLLRTNLFDRNAALSSIAYIYGSHGYYDQAKEVIHLFDPNKPIEKQIWLLFLAHMAIRSEHKKEAIQLVEESVAITLPDPEPVWKEIFRLSLTGEAYRQLGMYPEYFKSVEAMLPLIEKDKTGIIVKGYDEMILNLDDCLAKSKSEDLANKVKQMTFDILLKTVQNEEINQETLTIVLNRIILNKGDDLNRLIIPLIKNNRLSGQEMSLLLIGAANQIIKENPKESKETVKKVYLAINQLSKISVVFDKKKVAIEAANMFFLAQMDKEGFKEIDFVLTNINNNPGSNLYQEIVVTLLSANKINKAMSILKENLSSITKNQLRMQIITYYFQNHQVKKGEQLIQDIFKDDPGYIETSIYYELAKLYWENNNHEKALFYIEKADDYNKSLFKSKYDTELKTDQPTDQLAEDASIQAIENLIEANNIKKAKQLLPKAVKNYQKEIEEYIKEHSYFYQKTDLFKLTLLSAKLDDDQMVNSFLKENHGYKETLLDIISREYLKQNNDEKFMLYYTQLSNNFLKDLLLVEAFSQMTSKKLQQFAEAEATKGNKKAIISLQRSNQAIQHIQQKEYEKAEKMIEQFDLYYDKATVMAMLACEWVQ